MREEDRKQARDIGNRDEEAKSVGNGVVVVESASSGHGQPITLDDEGSVCNEAGTRDDEGTVSNEAGGTNAVQDKEKEPRAYSEGGTSRSMVLRESRVMAPTFQAGQVLCHDITTTSARITWPKSSDNKYPVYSYRVCTGEVGSGFEVTYAEAPSHTTEAVVVGLKPGKSYQFHVASVSAERMLVPGSSMVSNPVTLLEPEYEQAWFFERGEDDFKWIPFEGLGADRAGPTGSGGSGGDTGGSSTAMDEISCCPSTARCYTGLQSLCLTVPPGLAGGAYVDTAVKDGWLYIVKVRVFREQEGTQAAPEPKAEATGTTKVTAMTSPAVYNGSRAAPAATARLMLWDFGDIREMSEPAVKTGEWETLECKIIPFRSETIRIAVLGGGEEGQGNIYIDAVELFHGGPTPSEIAVSSINGFMNEPRSMPSTVLVRMESARAVRAADAMGTSDPFVKVFVGNTEIYRTKVVPMTLSPVWDERFFLTPAIGSGANANNMNQDGVHGGVRFEIWDHDFHGEGDYLGEVVLSNDQLRAALPYSVEYKAMRHPSRSGDDTADHTKISPEESRKMRLDQLKRGGRGSGGGRGIGEDGPPTFLALAVQVSWPEDASKAEGKLVHTLQNEEGLLATRVKALKELSAAACREPRNIEDAAKAKEALLRARAPEAAVWVLSDPNFVEDAAALLVGLVKLGHDALKAEAGFSLSRRLQAYVLQLSPAVVAVRCLRAGIGSHEILLELLARLYVGQQAALHVDVIAIPGLFHFLVIHVDALASAQALMREIGAGGREFSPELVEMFRRYRTRIPALPGLWRTSVLQILSAEEAYPPDPDEMDYLEGNEEDGEVDTTRERDYKDWFRGMGIGGGLGEGVSSALELLRGNLIVALTVLPPILKAGVGAKRVGGSFVEGGGSCEQPVGTVLLVDGLLLAASFAYGGCFRINRRHFSAIAAKWLFPTLFAAFLLHLGLVVGLLISIARVTSVRAGAGRRRDDGEVTCSSGTFAWGVLFLVIDLLCLVVPPVWSCVQCYEQIMKAMPPELARSSTAGIVVPDERHASLGDAKPVGGGGGGRERPSTHV